MKRIILFITVFTLTLGAAEHRILLETTGPHPEAAFFIDFSKIKPDSSSMRLTTPDKKEIPFSFDFAYGPPPPKEGEFVKEPDGFYAYGKGRSPVSEKKYIRPGWISFRKIPGVNQYLLRFKDGAADVTPHTNPVVRAWWIELMDDPYLRQPVKGPFYSTWQSSKQSELVNLPEGGIEVTGPAEAFSPKKYSFAVFFRQKHFKTADERLSGRSLVVYTVLSSDKSARGQFHLPFQSAVRKKHAAVHVYYDLKPGVRYEQYAEGLVVPKAAEFWLSNKWIGFDLKDPVKIHEFRLQSPPANPGVVLNYRGPALVNPGDDIIFSASNLDRDVFQKMTFKTAAGEIFTGGRAENWKDNWRPEIRITDASGKVVQSSDRLSFKLSNLPIGKYQIAAVLLSRDGKDVIAEEKTSVRIVSGPQW